MKPTPGPWYYCYGAVWTTPNGPEDGGRCVATRASNAPIEPTERDANMRLCSKAQAMREALEAIIGARDSIADGAVWPTAFIDHAATDTTLQPREDQAFDDWAADIAEAALTVND
jgi:hypothetical protein